MDLPNQAFDHRSPLHRLEDKHEIQKQCSIVSKLGEDELRALLHKCAHDVEALANTLGCHPLAAARAVRESLHPRGRAALHGNPYLVPACAGAAEISAPTRVKGFVASPRAVAGTGALGSEASQCTSEDECESEQAAEAEGEVEIEAANADEFWLCHEVPPIRRQGTPLGLRQFPVPQRRKDKAEIFHPTHGAPSTPPQNSRECLLLQNLSANSSLLNSHGWTSGGHR